MSSARRLWRGASKMNSSAVVSQSTAGSRGPAYPYVSMRRCRRGPVGAAPDAVLVGHIRRVLEASPFHGEGYRKAWAKLRVAGIRSSKERVRRLMREHDL